MLTYTVAWYRYSCGAARPQCLVMTQVRHPLSTPRSFYLSSCMRDMLCVPRLDQVVDGAAVRGGDASEYGFPCTKSYSATLFPILFSYLTWKQVCTCVCTCLTSGCQLL